MYSVWTLVGNPINSGRTRSGPGNNRLAELGDRHARSLAYDQPLFCAVALGNVFLWSCLWYGKQGSFFQTGQTHGYQTRGTLSMDGWERPTVICKHALPLLCVRSHTTG